MLETYRAKRDFKHTPEPPPRKGKQNGKALTYVIQEHDATRLHFDFRLELDGVLLSWAVPKGPSLNPADKRLAVHVEDHPIDYGGFEGSIPEGHYGAGNVIVWDRGEYTALEDDAPVEERKHAEEVLREQLKAGSLKIFLTGEKLHGGWALVRMKGEVGKNWLLIKENDEFADHDHEYKPDNVSVITGKHLSPRQRGAAKTAEHEKENEKEQERQTSTTSVANMAGARRSRMPKTFVQPMLATLTDVAFSDPDWVFEPKLDGMRILAHLSDGDVRLYARSGADATKRFPSLVKELEKLTDRPVILDGEVVALDEKGAPSFQELQHRINLTEEGEIQRLDSQIPVYFFVFDVLHLDGYDLRGATIENRRKALVGFLEPTKHIQLTAQFPVEGETTYAAAVEHGFEGVIAKRRDSVYEPRRSKRWLKIKSNKTDEFVIGGYTQGTGRRNSTFGALLVGQYDNQKKLVYSGHVGTGYDAATLGTLLGLLKPLAQKKCPFVECPDPNMPAIWVQPKLVAEVKFMQRTQEGILRAPVFLSLREDKPVAEVKEAEVVYVEEAVKEAKPAAQPKGVGDESVLQQLDNKKNEVDIEVGEHTVPVTSLNKVLWPETDTHPAFTKRDLMRYYAQCHETILHHTKDRPVTLRRFPDGITGEDFFQRHWPHKLHPFVETVRVFVGDDGTDQDFLLCNNLPTLLWLAQVADLELHTWFGRIDPEPDGKKHPQKYTGSEETLDKSLLNYPDFLVFDLDPYLYSGKEKKGAEPELNPKAFAQTCEVALYVKEIVEKLKLTPFIKTSGKTGLHIYVPLKRDYTYEVVRATCETIGQFLMKAHAKDVTMEWSVAKRKGKVFFDHNMNARSKTIASVWSTRSGPEAGVSTPINWNEVGKIYPSEFNLLTAPKRLAEVGDLWSNILGEKRGLSGEMVSNAS
jgi:bifunctional non-homologous end joining protein LigD